MSRIWHSLASLKMEGPSERDCWQSSQASVVGSSLQRNGLQSHTLKPAPFFFPQSLQMRAWGPDTLTATLWDVMQRRYPHLPHLWPTNSGMLNEYCFKLLCTNRTQLNHGKLWAQGLIQNVPVSLKVRSPALNLQPLQKRHCSFNEKGRVLRKKNEAKATLTSKACSNRENTTGESCIHHTQNWQGNLPGSWDPCTFSLVSA